MIGLMTIGGVQLIMIGIVGEYIGKILSELKARPIYFVAEHSEKRADGETSASASRADRRRMNDAARCAGSGCAPTITVSAEGVNRAIRDLIDRGRLNATSVMVVGPAIGRDEVAALQDAAANSPRCAIGLHATLDGAVSSADDAFPAARWRLVPAVSEPAAIGPVAAARSGDRSEDELLVQLAAFKELFGRAPDFVDGHQHAQLFPQVRDAFLRGGEGSRAQRLGPPGRTRLSRWPGGSARPRRWCSTF